MFVQQWVPSPASLIGLWKAGDDMQQPALCLDSVEDCRSQLESLLAAGQSSMAKAGASPEKEDAFGLTSPDVAGQRECMHMPRKTSCKDCPNPQPAFA